MTKPHVTHASDVAPVPCPCGQSRRIITRAQSPEVGLHVTHIVAGEAHYHKRTTEIYYVLSGHGMIELDGKTHELTPGSTVHIPPGVKHRGWGDFETIVVTSPAFDAADEFVAD
jgi:quercetin dioxygenase-like cupin family protein